MISLEQLKQVLSAHKEGLCDEIDAGGLFTRNSIAHKWQVTYRTIVLRELVSWRFIDLLQQSIILEEAEKYTGSRIIIRAAIETLAILLYCTKKMENIVNTGSGFEQYGKKTVNLLFGSRDESTKTESLNVLNIICLLYTSPSPRDRG